ncbi:MAG: GNAT family N-acetyltransferase [candidate division WOR-3 bacterium]|nr:MAG: GNAT family N-acetyltransferase [candidate division WOR-3 bacterium]
MQIPAVEFKLLDKQDSDRVRACAGLMAASEPWITLERTEDDVIKIIDDETSEAYVAMSYGKIIGFAIIKIRGAFVGYIQSVVILPRYRRGGIGTKFMEFLEHRILSELPNVFICVSSFNHDAKRLYERLGYETIGRLKDYIVKGHDEILMRKSVAPLSEFKREPK